MRAGGIFGASATEAVELAVVSHDKLERDLAALRQQLEAESRKKQCAIDEATHQREKYLAERKAREEEEQRLTVKCGGASSVGGCGKDMPIGAAYRCSDCEQYFHRDCLREHCETSSYVTAIRQNTALIDGWKKDVAKAVQRAEAAEAALQENAALRKELPDCLAGCEREATHVEQNGSTLRIKFGEEHEGRCRELCAMYLREFILTYRMGQRLADLNVALAAEPCATETS